MELKDKVINMINTENKKNPLTDLEIAKFLNATREHITGLRKELNLPNSRQRRYPYLKAAILGILQNHEKAAIAEITRRLLEQGFNISRKIVEEMMPLEEPKQSAELSAIVEKEDPFQQLIGCRGSLKNSIEQAKSAILYPPKGLPTLIAGQSGVGKSLFARTMYEFAKENQMISPMARFVVFNCADYGDNPQLLLSLLFGYKKGAFTGAMEDMPGLAEEANGGILFLDEIHRLPPKGQEILFSILDRGKFRRLGESNTERSAHLMLIGATTEDLETNLLLTFRRRIPMIIHLPSLEQRFLKEKISLIYTILQQECNRMNTKVFIDKNVVEILALHEFSGNIGQLQNVIQVLCARSFMKFVHQKEAREKTLLSIDVSEILKLIDSFKDTSFVDIEYSKIRKYLKNIILIPFQEENLSANGQFSEEQRLLSQDIYKSIEAKYTDLQNLNLSEHEIESILWAFVLNRFHDEQMSFEADQDLFSLQDLKGVVKESIIEVIDQFMQELVDAHAELGVNKNAFKYLAIHLEEAMKKIRLNQSILNVHTRKIQGEFTKEYALSKTLVSNLEAKEKISIPEAEIAFIALYLRSALYASEKKDRIGLILISHGHIASETVKVIKELLGTKIPMAIDMPLNEKPMHIYHKAVELSKVMDQGRGILFLVDIGSLTSIGEIVYERTGIKTQTLDRTDLLLALEAAREVSIGEASLDEIYFSLRKDRPNYSYIMAQKNDKPNAIITICLTGEGNAKYISQEIEARYPKLHCCALSAMDENLAARVQALRQENNILAIVGTMNPKIAGINFIPYDHAALKNLDLFLSLRYVKQPALFLDESLMIYEPDLYTKEDLLAHACSLLVNKGYVAKEYLASVLHRETLLPTFAKGNLAVPHGNSAAVAKTSFVFAKLKNPVDWGVGIVNFLFMPVFTADDREIVKEMLQILKDEAWLQTIRSSGNRADFIRVIRDKVKSILRNERVS